MENLVARGGQIPQIFRGETSYKTSACLSLPRLANMQNTSNGKCLQNFAAINSVSGKVWGYSGPGRRIIFACMDLHGKTVTRVFLFLVTLGTLQGRKHRAYVRSVQSNVTKPLFNLNSIRRKAAIPAQIRRLLKSPSLPTSPTLSPSLSGVRDVTNRVQVLNLAIPCLK